MFRRCARAGRPVAEGPRGRRDPDVVRRGAGEGAPLAAGLAATPRVLRHRRVTERRRGLGHVRVRTAARVKRLDLRSEVLVKVHPLPPGWPELHVYFATGGLLSGVVASATFE